MGAFWSLFSSRVEKRVVILGLDGAGKTTLLYNLHLGEIVRTIPTIGFNVERVTYNGYDFNMWDIGGQTRMRNLWHHYLKGTDALLFVVDSNDPDRLEESKRELALLLQEYQLSDAVILVHANKSDIPGCLSPVEVSEGLGLPDIQTHTWRIQECCARTGKGVKEGLEWVIAHFNQKS